MGLIFLFSKDNLELANAELKALLNDKRLAENKIKLTEEESAKVKELAKRLAYTRTILLELLSCDYKNLGKEIKKFEWEKVYSGSFSIRKTGFNENKIKEEKDYAGFVWKKLKSPKVDLKEAKTKIVILCDKKVHVCLLLAETDRSYLLRKAHLRPSLHPTSMNPKLAKAMVNLTGAQKGDFVCDPFCGSAGILIEAGLMGMKTIGIDISEKLVSMAKKNLEHYKVKYFKLIVGDSTKERIKADYVVTDFPYGRNSKVSSENGKLYADFLKNLKGWKVKKAVIGFPDFVDCKKIIKKEGFKIENEFEEYLHKSLKKKIVVISLK